MTSIPNPRRVSFTRPARPARTGATTATSGNRERFWLPVAIVAAALVGLAGWMLLVSPLRDDAAAASSQAETVTTQVDTLRSKLAQLQTQQGDLPRYRAELKAAQAALPTTAALPAFLRTLQELGTSTGTTVTSLNATEPDGTTVAAGNNVPGVGKVYSVPVTVTVTGGYDGITAFVGALQGKQPRAVLVDSVSETAGEGNSVSVTLAMTAFVAPTAGSTSGG